MTWDSLAAHRRSGLGGYSLKHILKTGRTKLDFGGVVLAGDGLVNHIEICCPNYFSENCHMGSKSEK